VEAFASLRATLARVRDAIERGRKDVARTLDKPPLRLTAEDIVLAARQGHAVAKTASLPRPQWSA
jgi:hypothetical protein